MKAKNGSSSRFTAILTLILLIVTAGCSGHSGEQATEDVKDIDGNTYHTVSIGRHVWMSENLKVSRYRNGEPIPEKTSADEWPALQSGAWASYENNKENGQRYGYLYNWFAVNDPRGLAPVGWHVATDAEWSELASTLGGEEKAGNALKAPGQWKDAGPDKQQASGFNSLPAGARRDSDGQFVLLGEFARFWTSSVASGEKVFGRAMEYYDGALRHGEVGRKNGFSVRCVRD
jgi:uncharacterized protein (TIGR02145 family)